MILGLVRIMPVWRAFSIRVELHRGNYRHFRETTATCATLFISAFLVAGCTTTMPGQPMTSPPQNPVIRTDDVLVQALPTSEYLQDILDHPAVSTDADLRVGVGEMSNGNSVNMKSGPRNCLLVPGPAMDRTSYGPFNPQAYARRRWTIDLTSGSESSEALLKGPSGLWADAIALPETNDAKTAFDSLSQAWKACEGEFVAVYEPQPPDSETLFMTSTIEDVRTQMWLVSATVPNSINDHGPFVFGRALGVQGNCIVEVTIVYQSGIGSHATEIARHMMTKITELG